MENDTVFILLAGGKAERMGVAKGLLPYQNTYWILEQIDRISTSTLTEVYIGLGFNYREYLNKISWFSEAQSHFVLYKNVKVRVVINQKPEFGSFSTLQTVLQQIQKTKSVLISPIDIPILNTAELQSIMEAQNLIVIPNYKGKNGHPIKLNSEFWKPLLSLNPLDQNSRLDLEIKKTIPLKITTITITDSCILKNLNSPKDWMEFLKA